VIRHPLSAAVLASAAEPGTSQTIAVIAERRLGVAALTAVLQKGMDYHLVAEARGELEVRAAIDTHRPAVIIEAPLSEFPSSLLGDGQGGGFGVPTLVVGPNDRSDQLASSIRAAMTSASTRTTDEREEGDAAESGLSQREREILTGIASGRSTKQVARDCGIRPKTVGNHVNNICHKLNLHHRAQLVLFALQQGLTPG
jgi:DNA-binding CsgD family transcriptional regulator